MLLLIACVPSRNGLSLFVSDGQANNENEREIEESAPTISENGH